MLVAVDYGDAEFREQTPLPVVQLIGPLLVASEYAPGIRRCGRAVDLM